MSSSFGATQPPTSAAAAVAAATTTTDQVTIDVENGILNANNRNDQLNLDLIAVDGRRHGHQRHGSGGSHHHNNHESDADDPRRSTGHRPRHRRRSRSRSRSHSPSPHRSKRATDTGVGFIQHTHTLYSFFCLECKNMRERKKQKNEQ